MTFPSEPPESPGRKESAREEALRAFGGRSASSPGGRRFPHPGRLLAEIGLKRADLEPFPSDSGKNRE